MVESEKNLVGNLRRIRPLLLANERQDLRRNSFFGHGTRRQGIRVRIPILRRKFSSLLLRRSNVGRIASTKQKYLQGHR